MRRFTAPSVLFAALAAVLFAPAAAPAGDRTPPATALGAAQPRLLNDYERVVLNRELVRLMREVAAARAAAAEDESLAPLKAEVEEARRSGDAKAHEDARRRLADAVETILYRDEAIPPKIARLQDVGNLLEYDNRVRREQRARLPRRPESSPAPAPAPEPTPEPTPAPAPEAAPGAAGEGEGD